MAQYWFDLSNSVCVNRLILCLHVHFNISNPNFYYRSYMYFLKNKLKNLDEQNKKINTGYSTKNQEL